MMEVDRETVLVAAVRYGRRSTSTVESFDLDRLIRFEMGWSLSAVTLVRMEPEVFQVQIYEAYLRGIVARHEEEKAYAEHIRKVERMNYIARRRLMMMLSTEQQSEWSTYHHVTEQSRFTGKWFRFHQSWAHAVQIVDARPGRRPSEFAVRLQVCVVPNAIATPSKQIITDFDIITSFLGALRGGDEVRLLSIGLVEQGYYLPEEQEAIRAFAQAEHTRVMDERARRRQQQPVDF